MTWPGGGVIKATSVVAPGFHAQQELPGGLVVDWAALGVLGHDVDILESAMDRISGEYRVGTAQIIGRYPPSWPPW